MQIFQLIGVAFVTAIAALILKGTKPELAFAVTVAGSVILLLVVFDIFRDGIRLFGSVADASGLDPALVKILLKMVGIGYLVEFSAGVLADFGQNSLADKLVFCGKLLVLVLAVPIFESVLSLVRDLMGLVK